MKRTVLIVLSILMFAALMTACGGGAPAEPAAPAEVVEEAVVEPIATVAEATSAAPTTENTEDTPTEAPSTEAATPESDEAAPAPEEPAEADGSLVAGRPASGIDPESGLEINPPQVLPGVDYLIRGKLVSFNLTPQDAPEFLFESPDGTRYRIRPQPLPEITFEDGTKPAPHEYRQGQLAQATARLDDSGGVTTVMLSSDMVLLQE